MLLRRLRRQRFTPPIQFGQTIAAAALGERRLLRRALRDAHPLAAAGQPDIGLVLRAWRADSLRAISSCSRDWASASSAAIARRLFLLLRLLRGEIGELLRDLRAPPFGRLRRLLQLEELELQVVAATLLRPERETLRVVGLLRRIELGGDRGQRFACGGRRGDRGRDAQVELGQLALPGKDTMELVVGRKKTNRVRADKVPLRRDKGFADVELGAVGERLRGVVAAPDAAQPVGEQARHVRAGSAHLQQQRIGRRRRGHRRRGITRRIQCKATGRRGACGEPRGGGVEAVELDRIQSFAQHRFEGILPSGLDVEALPEAMRARKAPLFEPSGVVLALPDLRLQRGERLRPRFELRLPAGRLLRRVARAALPFLQRLHPLAQRAQRRLLARELDLFLGELLVDLPQRSVASGASSASSPARRKRRSANCINTRFPLSRLVSATRIACSIRAICCCISATAARGFLDRFLERRQCVARDAFFAGGRFPRGQRVFEHDLRGGAVRGKGALLRPKRRELLGQLRKLLREAGFALAGERELLLQASDLGVGRVELALPFMQRIAGGVVSGTQGFAASPRSP